ncbi:glycosyltransferase family 9 protein [Brachyspira pilosicoli]|uniref:Glycosyl transferase, family 9 n=1 Tax=Brachyspira pilosicoli (strain ATCC BAA-1826 / 95/1000) TaxID=759914 RepID=D8IFW5_BRAP9|nr:glycosyltransferase family 9 protein [Brachyspira pilosicoli]ADK30012.1 glycosyl transferase, family 9 [Brachyspira pilosicoli 95/1000]SUW07820.1 family 9 glycosyltransferase [Brachyspira pilosicoli]
MDKNIEKIINEIAWWIPFKNKRNYLKNELKKEIDKILEDKNKIINDKNCGFQVLSISNKKEYSKNIAIYFDSGIGDYMFFRPFLPYIRNCFKNDKLTFIGSARFLDIVLFFDKENIDEYIYFEGNDNYYYEQLEDFFENIHYDILISHYYLRMLSTDRTISLINSKEKISNYGALLNLTKRQRVNNIDVYTRFIYPDENDKFELYRNIDFFREVLNENIEINNLSIQLNEDYFNNINFNFNQKYSIIFPGSTDINRQWNPSNFSYVADHLYYKYNIISYVVGSEKEEDLAIKIIGNKKHIISICGKYQLHKLFYLFNKSRIVITNDSAGYHIAMAVSSNVIVISSGGSYTRFINYPEKYKKDKIVSTPIPDGAFNIVDIEYFYNRDFLNTITSENICSLIDEKHSEYLIKE